MAKQKPEVHGTGYGPPCPSNPEHGRLLDGWGDRWYCPHSEHSSRKGSEHVTAREATRRWFTSDEAFGTAA